MSDFIKIKSPKQNLDLKSNSVNALKSKDASPISMKETDFRVAMAESVSKITIRDHIESIENSL